MPRARIFDVDQAIDQALQLFWRNGYEGTTLSDLTAALRINRPSLYAAFGSKEELFRRALERYVAGPGKVSSALEAPTAREAVFRLMRFYADAIGHPERPVGCFLVQGALVSGESDEPIRIALVNERHFAETRLAERLYRAKREGDLPADANPRDLARYVYTVCHGLAVQSFGGATRKQTRKQLRRVVDIAMRAWPE
jgi:AcrR family transcriptional regulator